MPDRLTRRELAIVWALTQCPESPLYDATLEGLSQQQLARLLGISHQRVGIIERRALVKLRRLADIHLIHDIHHD